MSVWRCSGCGIESPGRVRSCNCITSCLYRGSVGNFEHSTKVPSVVEQTALARLHKAIVDHTKGDMFWIGEILLSELEKETGFKPGRD